MGTSPNSSRTQWEGPFRSNWVSVLAALENGEILEADAQGPREVTSVCCSNGKQITRIGSSGGGPIDPAMESCKSADAIAIGSPAVAVVGEDSFFDPIQSALQFREALAKVGSALKPEGLLALCFREGFGQLRHRYWIRRVLAQEGFKSIRCFLADPSEDSLTFVPYSDDPTWATNYLCNYSRSQLRAWTLLKQGLKRVLYAALGIYNPRFALLILARKCVGEPTNRTPGFSQRLKKLVSQKGEFDRGSVVVAVSRRTGRLYLFDYDKVSSRLLAVALLSSKRDDVFGLVRRSYDNLILLSSLEDVFAEQRIALPTLLDFEITGSMTFYVQRAISGKCLESFVDDCWRRDDRTALARLVGSALDIQMFVQDKLTCHLGCRAPRIDDTYFDNYLDLPLDDERPSAENYNGTVQHGDFAPVNILYDCSEERWGIIDWEWMSAAYPPLFDVFSFLSAVTLAVDRQQGAARVRERVDRFARVFFNTTWFSRVATDRILHYCNRYGIPRSQVFRLFLRFLLFQCGKYRLTVVGYADFLRSYEEMLRYSVAHKDRFILA